MSDNSRNPNEKKNQPYTFPLPVHIEMGNNGDGITVRGGKFIGKISLDKFSRITLLGSGTVTFTIEERKSGQYKPLMVKPKPDLYNKGYRIIGKNETQKTLYVYYKRTSDLSYYFEQISQRGDDRRFLGSLKKPKSKIRMALSLIDQHFPNRPFSLADARAAMRNFKGLRHSLTTRAIMEVLTIDDFLRKMDEKDKRGSEIFVRMDKYLFGQKISPTIAQQN